MTWRSTSGVSISLPRSAPSTCAAISSASVRGDATPASARMRSASMIASRSGCLDMAVSLSRRLLRGESFVAVGGGERVEHAVQVAVEHLVQVVGLVVHAVVGDAVLREVVGAD